MSGSRPAFYSQRVQDCAVGVKVMTEVDPENGQITGIESVKLPKELEPVECPLLMHKGDKLEGLVVIKGEGSNIKCRMECGHRMVERL